MTKIDKNYDKYISPSITKGVTGQAAKGKTTSGKAVQVLDNMKNIATTKAHRTHGALKGEGWNNNLTALKAMHRDIREVRISLNQMKDSDTQMTRMNFNSKVDKLDKTLSKITKTDDLFGKNSLDIESDIAPLLPHRSVEKPMTQKEIKKAEVNREVKRSAEQGEADFQYSARELNNL